MLRFIKNVNPKGLYSFVSISCLRCLNFRNGREIVIAGAAGRKNGRRKEAVAVKEEQRPSWW